MALSWEAGHDLPICSETPLENPHDLMTWSVSVSGILDRYHKVGTLLSTSLLLWPCILLSRAVADKMPCAPLLVKPLKIPEQFTSTSTSLSFSRTQYGFLGGSKHVPDRLDTGFDSLHRRREYLSCSRSATTLTEAQHVHQRLKRPIAQLPGPWISKWTGVIATYYWLTGQRANYIHRLHQQYGTHS